MTRFQTLFARFDIISILALLFLWAPLCILGWSVAKAVFAAPALLRFALPTTPLRWELLLNTVELGIGTVALSLLLGLPVAITLARGPNWLRALVAVGSALPLALPPILPATLLVPLTFAPGADASKISPALIASPALAAWLYPLVGFGVASALRCLPPESEEAARAFGSEWHAWRRVIIPTLKPAIFGTAGLCFAFSLWEMGAPDLLNLQTYAVQIHRDWNAGNLGDNAVLPALDALPLVLLGALALWPAFSALRFYERLRAGSSNAPKRATPSYGTIERSANALSLITIILSPGLILGAMLRHAGTFSGSGAWARAGELSRPELLTTLSLAPLSALLLVAWAFAIAARARLHNANYASRKSGHAGRVLLVFPLLCPPMTLALALIGLWNAPMRNGFALQDAATWLGSGGMTVVGYLARFLPPACWMMSEAAARVPDDALEAAESLGASPNRVARGVLLPLMLPALSALGAVMGALCVGELTVSVLVANAGGQPLTVPLFNFMHIGEEDVVAAISLWLFGVGALTMAGFALGGFFLRALWRKLSAR